MINFYSENDFELDRQEKVENWISSVIENEGFKEGEITFVFCSDEYLADINREFLNHDTYTDIISFDYSLNKELHGEIYISTDRVTENAQAFETSFSEELHRVIIHGILHFCGYKDKDEKDLKTMRSKENEALYLRDFI
jgi:rRNA maturation RNase YbeY